MNAEILFKNFDMYNKDTQSAIIEFITNNNYIDENEIIKKLKSPPIDVEVKCKILGYFRKNHNYELKDYIVRTLSKENLVANDFVIKAIGTLWYYNDEETKALLKKLKLSHDLLIKESAYKSIKKIKSLENKEHLVT